MKSVDVSPEITVGGDLPLFICGPCVVENYDITAQTAHELQKIFHRLGLPFVFKSSFDKANRTSGKSFRSLGFDAALAILQRVKETEGVALLTDIHETCQASPVAEVVDILQIPAFLCRQTDLIYAAAQTGRAVNIKKGQFMAPEDMAFAVEKCKDRGNAKVFLTERGNSFGYHNLVVDMRSLVVMRRFAPVIFDLTHSVQTPGGMAGKSGGQREFAPYLARAAAAVGVDGFFMEVHPDPVTALSDGPNMVPLAEVEQLVKNLLSIWLVAHHLP